MKTGCEKVSKTKIKTEGFSLLEVMIAVMILSMFSSSYLMTQGFHVAGSAQMQKELILQKLCYNKMQEITLKPPEFTDSLDGKVSKSGNFDEEGYPNHTYTIEYKKLELPDMDKITGGKESGGNSENGESGESGESGSSGGSSNREESQADGFKNKIFEIFKKSIEQRVWQARVTVREKDDDFYFSLTALLTNAKAPPINLPF